MAISTALRTQIKNLCFISSTTRDTDISSLYIRELQKLCLELGWLVEREDISATANTHIYTTQTRCTQVLALLHNRILLKKTHPSTHDNITTTWQSDANSTPEIWWNFQLPQSLDSLSSITPDQFIVHPAPSSSGSGTSGFYAYEVCYPSGDDPTPTWIDPYLIFKTSAAVLRNFGEEREGEELGQLSKQLIDFYEAIADLWKSVLIERIP